MVVYVLDTVDCKTWSFPLLYATELVTSFPDCKLPSFWLLIWQPDKVWTFYSRGVLTAVNLGFSRPGLAYYSYLQIGHDQFLPYCSLITVLFTFPHWTPQCTVLWIQSHCGQTSRCKYHTRHISVNVDKENYKSPDCITDQFDWDFSWLSSAPLCRKTASF